MSIDFAEILSRMVAEKASDVHLSAGFAPAMRVRGRVVPMEGHPKLKPQDTREIIYSLINDSQRKRFENEQQLDFAYSVPGIARFRVNIFFQRGSISAAFRHIPNELKSLDELGMPAVLAATLQFMHRYLHVLTDELDRMLKARRSRTFRRTGRLDWGLLTGCIGILFLRAFERGERVHAAMLARGWDGTIRTLDATEARRA